jgi:hypothetical protein
MRHQEVTVKKFVVALAVTGLAGAGIILAPAHAEDVSGCVSDVATAAGLPDAGVGDICGAGSQDGTGHITIDGAESNQDPADGFISAANDGSQDEDGVCASAQGDPGEEYDDNGVAIEDDDETPACDEALPQAIADAVTGGLPALSL